MTVYKHTVVLVDEVPSTPNLVSYIHFRERFGTSRYVYFLTRTLWFRNSK